MCNPMYAAMSASGVGAAVTAYGRYQQGQSESDRLNFQADIAEDNADLVEYSVKAAKSAGKRAERKHGQKVRQIIGKQRVSYAGRGVDVSAGSPAEVIDETRLHGEDDAAVIRYNSAMQVWGLNRRAANYRQQASLYRMGADDARIAGSLAAGTTLLTGLATIGTNYALWKGKK